VALRGIDRGNLRNVQRLLERRRLREQLDVCENALKALRWHELNVERERILTLKRLAATRARPAHRACTF
jgi:hypothetical protein